MNFAQIQAVDLVRKNTAAEIAALLGSYIEGRFYEVIGSNQMRRALDASTLSEPIVFGTGNVDQLAQRVTTLEQNSVSTATFNNYQDSVATALAGKVDNSTFNNYQSSVTAALADKLGKTEKAVDATLFDGHSYTEVQAAWVASIAAREAIIMAAIAEDVKHVYAINFSDGDTINASDLDGAAGVDFANLSDGKYLFILNGSGTAQANITNYQGSDAPAAHTGSNNDQYIATVISGTITSIARRNDTTSEALSAFQAAMAAQGVRITALEGIGTENGVEKVAGKYGLGSPLTRNTAIGGNFDLTFDCRIVAKNLVVEDLSNPAKYYRIAIQNDTLVYGEVTYPN